MHAFEMLIAEIMEGEGYWVRRSVKVDLTKDDKQRINRKSCPRWEIDLVAYNPPKNELIVMECKSYLDSTGVALADIQGGRYAKRYKLFTEPILREVVLNRLSANLVDQGFCAVGPRMTLALTAGRIKGDPAPLQAHFASNDWELRGPDWVRAALRRAVTKGYSNSVAAMVAKLLEGKSSDIGVSP